MSDHNDFLCEGDPTLPPPATTTAEAGQLERWLADERSDEAIAQRRRTWWLRRLATEEATFAGMLMDLAERAATVTVHTISGQRHHARIDAVGADVVVLARVSGDRAVVPLRAVTMVAEPDDGIAADRDPTGSRQAGAAGDLAAVLGAEAADRPWVAVTTSAGMASTVHGQLVAAGQDVLTLRIDNTGGRVYLPLHSMSELVLTVSG